MIWWIVGGLVLALAVAVLLWPSPFARLLSRRRIASPIALPADVTLRVYPRWLLWPLEVIGGGIGATTFGTTIYISPRPWYLTSDYERRRLLEHELVHVEQSRRYGVLYLPRYLVLLVRYGRQNHPMEIEAG